MAGDTRMARKVALLLWAQTLGLIGAQTTQLLVEPRWRPAVLWDRVTLTCQGSGTAGATTWYKDGQRWGQQGLDHFTVIESGTYTCDRPGTGHSPPVTVSKARLVLQVPAQELLEGDMVTLRCRRWENMLVTGVLFYHGDKEVERSLNGTELSLSPLQLNHSGRYSCGGQVDSKVAPWALSASVTVTVHALRKQQERALSEPLAPPEAGEVLYSDVVSTKKAGREYRGDTGDITHSCHPQSRSPQPVSLTGPPRATSPQAIYADLPGPHWRQQDPSDICENVL